MRAYERLLNYVRVHTTSDENSGTHPSAEREFDLARQLVDEMKALGMEDAHVVCARTRPKFIGGGRAVYDDELL